MKSGRLMRPAMLLVAAVVSAAGCAGPPWQMGSPLDGKPSIPRGVAHFTTAQRRAELAAARAAGRTVIELRELGALESAERLTAAESDRLFDLLVQRAEEFRGLGRAVPRCEDLRRATLLLPARGKALRTVRAQAERDAGDAWLAIGEATRAAGAYREAEALGALDVEFRMMATRNDVAPEVLAVPDLAQAIAVLPLRAVPPFAQAYVTGGGDHLPTLRRSLAAARQERKGQLRASIEAAIARLDETTEAAREDSATRGENGRIAQASVDPSEAAPLPPDLEQWLLAGASLSARLLPLLATHAELLQPDARARLWADLMLAEDPTSPEVQEVAALVDGLARRFGGAERKLLDLVFYSPDRYHGMVKTAVVWERVGRLRDACVQRVRAARWRDDPDDPMWRAAIACTRHDPGAGDWRGIRQYVIERAPPDRRAAIAASLDAPEGRIAAEEKSTPPRSIDR
ncbi:MAG TPA: hypothetical protein VFH73_03290 [Polyangia bacterium]|jgi:hypothetical protein|nr:hypothetical protein [Polyangia bacterium]